MRDKNSVVLENRKKNARFFGLFLNFETSLYGFTPDGTKSNAMLSEKVQHLSQKYQEDWVLHRRWLHRHPELSYQEYETQRYLSKQLSRYGIESTPIAGTGLVALIEGKEPESRTVALRADIDALPIQEANQCEYSSVNKGVMHACGHDVHASCLLGAARLLHELRDEWRGRVKILFQPAEEVTPGGATAMIAQGALENPVPGYILGQHADPMLPVGCIGLCPGAAMASADELHLTIEGKGGHGARPHQCIDPIVVAAHLIVALQQIVSRNANPLTPTVLTFGKIESDGGATNIIPERVFVKGTLRTFDEAWREQALERIHRMCSLLGESMGAKVRVHIPPGLPFVLNQPGLTEQLRQAAQTYLGAERVLDIAPRMGAEDFAHYSHRLPACFYRLGAQNPNGTDLHTPTFDIDEKALAVGVGLMAWLAMSVDGV